MSLNQHAITIARQLTKSQKMFLANIIDPQQRGAYKKACSDVNQSYLENKLKKVKKSVEQHDHLTGGDE